MLSENRQLQAKLAGVVPKVTSDRGLQEELLQVAVIRWSELEIERPGRRRSWYVQACCFHVLDYLRQGRSLDAPKRRHLGCPIEDVLGERDCPLPDCLICGSDPFQEASLADLVEEMKERLGFREIEVLSLLTEGYGNEEIAERMGISHTSVKKRRDRIAVVARRLGAT
ncbi:MAG TPA: LuxR C-terminal-related transcriptional regulator [Candidatus Binatia bacterium]|jgi:DNA-directed RNA polymerase specialized sigma24 family protein|nr:LuxR C-terminal-related transcriptional regulator [Candidatus Binatia bacterium]